ncbi:Ig-like domain-containing protein, partial [Escherichia fergusonii]|uniref:Ig-like domain-containing protein n=1 Tax=Escherichia fergusonii TaxID=564 RepID=UPI0020CDC27F
MKSVSVTNFDYENTRVAKLKVSGFDIIITDSHGEQTRIIDGLPGILTGELKLQNENGKDIDSTEIINSIDASRLGLDVSVLGSLLNGNDVIPPQEKIDEKTPHNETNEDATHKALEALSAENKELKEKLSKSHQQPKNEENIKIQVEIAEQKINEDTAAFQESNSPTLSVDNRPKKKILLLDDSGSSSSSLPPIKIYIHQDEIVAQHQDEVVTQHQDEVVAQHQDEVVAQHQDEVVAQHQDEVVAQHQDEVVTQAKQVVPQIDITAGLDIKTDSGIVGDNITNYSRPVLSGTTIVNSKISLFVAGEEYTATADSEGKWSIPVSNELEDGEYNYYITATAPDGRTGNYSDYFIIDTKDPDISFTLNGELRNDITNVTMPLLTGLTEAKSTVSIIIGDSEYYTTSNSVGEWSIQTTRALQEGINNYTVTVIDQAGNNSITQGTVTLDTTILPLTGIKFSHSADDRNSNTYTPTIEGWGEPGAMLTISIGSRSRTLTIPESRKWFFAVPPGFIQKGRTTQYISFKETDPAGNSNQKNIKFNFFTDKPDVSADLSPDSDTGIHGDKITNNLSPTLTGKISSARLSPDMIGRSKISLTIDGVTYSNISVDKNGNWSFKLPVELSPGYIYHYTVNASDFVGNTNSYTSFIKTSPLSGSLDIDSITGQNSIIETSNKLPTLSGTATIGSELVININNTSQKVSVDSSTGAWTYKVTESLGDGKHTFTLVEKNKNGKINTFNGYFIVDTRAPELTASISGIKDGKIHDPNVVFIGKTEPRALVTISVLGGTYQTKADNKGDWSYPLNNKELSVNQTINYSVIASNAAGNRSKASGSFYIDTINLTVGIDDQNSSKDKDVVTNNNKPIFSGVTENDSNVSLKINNDMYSTKADQYGHWSIE